MPTEAVSLFLFAHQDDEFGVFERIGALRRAGRRVVCAYLTDGQTASASARTRNAESTAVLGQLGVAPGDIHFAGQQLDIGDGKLALHLERAAEWIGAWFDSFDAIEAIYVLAWEGGHHDHDALHALTAVLAARRGLLGRCWQFPLYHARSLHGPFFRALDPLRANGPVTTTTIPWRARLAHLRRGLAYPSQWKTWIGLLPMMTMHYLLRGTEQLQPVSLERIRRRPHAGALYYEKRRFFTWERLSTLLYAWRSSLPPEPSR